MLQGQTIGFLGAGSIAEALMRGLIEKGVLLPHQIMVSNRTNQERLQSLALTYGVRPVQTKAELVKASDFLVLLCKPKDVTELLREIGPHTRAGQVLLTVAAGVHTDTIRSGVADGVQVVRAMPNTSCQVGESATAMAAGTGTSPVAMELCGAVLGAVGQVVEVPEFQLDAVTGLSGSGPAYVYLIVEAMVEAGVGVGLPEQTARELAVQTLKGAALMLAETGEDPAVLRRQVTSPGGTTMAGLQVLHEAGFTQALVRAIARATERSRELGAQVVTPQSLGAVGS